jgi:hypothetical protein
VPAYTYADLAIVRAALLRGEQTVKFSDRTVTFRSIADLLKLETRIISELSAVASAAAAAGTSAPSPSLPGLSQPSVVGVA